MSDSKVLHCMLLSVLYFKWNLIRNKMPIFVKKIFTTMDNLPYQFRVIPYQINQFEIKIWHDRLRFGWNSVKLFICMKKKNPPIFFFSVNHSPNRGSSKFDLFAPPSKAWTHFSQLLWDLEASSWYQMKGILKG